MIGLDPARWARLSPRIDALLALPPEQRSGRLTDIAVEDPDAAEELRALLAGLDKAVSAGFLSETSEAAWQGLRPAAGDALGAWTLIEEIGEGGMGTVWRARRNDGRFEGDAAIKLLRTGLFDVAMQERFRREGAILARLRHPGIAQLLDAGITPRGQPYLVLELVVGERLDAWADSHALGVRERVELFRQVLHSVSAAHGQLIIHRDLKPSNMIVDEGARVRLLDFGIARLLPEVDALDETALTGDGALALTPAFAAPEQFQRETLTMATDVYALGHVLYALLADKHPSGLAPGSSAIAYANAAADGRHVPASAAAPLRRQELKGDLDAILAKACAADPQARYASAAAFDEDLQRHLRNEPIGARTLTVAYRLGKLIRRHPFEAAVVAAIVLAVPAGAYVQVAVLVSLAIGFAVAIWQLRRARRQTAKAMTEQRRAEAVKAFIASTFSRAVPREGQGGTVTAADLLHSAHARVGTELRHQPAVAAELLVIVGDSFLDLGDIAAAHAVLHDAADHCQRVFGRTHALTMHARTGLAQTMVVRGELDSAEAVLPALVGDLRARMPGTAPDLVGALQHQSYVLTKRGDAEAALRILREATGIAGEHMPSDHRQAVAALGLLGNTLATFGRDSEAIDVLQPVIDAMRASPDVRRPNTDLARLEGYLAGSMIAVGRLREAEALLRQVLADQWSLDGCDTIRNRFTRGMLALVRQQRGDLSEAIELQRQALDADARLRSAPTVDTGTMTAQLGAMLVEAGQIEAGMDAIERAEIIIQEAGGAAQEYPLLRRRVRRAQALLTADRPADALACATDMLRREVPADDWIDAVARRVCVQSLTAMSRLQEAEEQLQDMLNRNVAPQVSLLNRCRAHLAAAELHVAQGRHAEGLELARQARTQLLATQEPDSQLLRLAVDMERRCEISVIGSRSKSAALWANSESAP